MARFTRGDIDNRLPAAPPSDDFWRDAVDAQGGSIAFREKLCDEGDVIEVFGEEFEVTAIEPPVCEDEGYIHRFTLLDTE